MKKILLFALDNHIVDAILSETDWVIATLVVPTDMYKEQYAEVERIKKIYTRYDFHRNKDLSGLDFKELEKFSHAQLRSENFYLRFLSDYQLGKYDYYCGFALAKRIFEENVFDMVIVDGLNEGRPSDMLLTEMAKYRGIPSYNTDASLVWKACIYDNTAEMMIPIQRDRTISIKESLFYENHLLDQLNPQVVYAHPVLNNQVAQRIEALVYRLFGQVGVDVCSCLYTLSNRRNTMGLTFSERFQSYRQGRKVKKWLENHMVSADLQKKYVFFALHYEPEASISGRGLMDSQLIAIRILSQLLPTGWVLYVKEHPDQFKVNDRVVYGYPVSRFKTVRFYEELMSFPNVRLVHTNISSKLLIQECQAVATIAGTILGEAISLKKPILTFAPQRLIYRMLKEAYNITSYDDCAAAIQEIQAKKNIEYADWEEVCQRYLFDVTAEGYKEAVSTLYARHS